MLIFNGLYYENFCEFLLKNPSILVWFWLKKIKY